LVLGDGKRKQIYAVPMIVHDCLFATLAKFQDKFLLPNAFAYKLVILFAIIAFSIISLHNLRRFFCNVKELGGRLMSRHK